MPEFFSLKKPPKEKVEELVKELEEYSKRKVEELVKELEEYSKRKVEELVKELEEYSKLRPFLTFNFPTNKDREKALKMIESGKLDTELLIKFLESDDFVVKLAMFYLLRKIHNLPEQERKKIVEKALPVLKESAKDESYWVRDQAIQALGNLGEIALPDLKELAENEDSVVRKQVAQALGNLGEKALPLLKKLIRDEDIGVRRHAILALGNIGEKALPDLKELAEKEDSFIREQVALALGNLGKIDPHLLKEIVLPLLVRLVEDKNIRVKKQAIQALGNLGEIALPVLKELAKDESPWVRGQVALALGNIGEKALPLLEELAKDEDSFVREKVAQALGNIGEKALPLLEELAKDEDSEVRKQATLALDKIKRKSKSKLWLLATKKPLFATPYTKELVERILEIQRIVKEMKDKFGDRFIGIVIVGSTAKGYFTPASDLDWSIIAKDEEVFEYFKKRAQELKLPLCQEHYIEVDETYKAKTETNIEILFYGLFFGDRKKLYEIQKNTLESMDPEKYLQEWDRIRKIIMGYELDLLKATERLGIEDEEMERIKIFSALLRVPPTYNEALEIVRRRAGLSSSA